MKFQGRTHEGRLLRRYKRFLADVDLGGRTVTVHCPNPGSMDGCAVPGSRVIVSESPNPNRKLGLTWELVRVGRSWVGINTSLTNAVVGEGLRRERFPSLAGADELRPEVSTGTGSRVDFRLVHAGRPCWVEVKNTTLAEGDVALFPDAVTARGLKHLRELAARARAGDRAVMLYLVNRGDCRVFRPADHVDPAYGERLRQAVGEGVEILVHAARVRTTGITVAGPLPVEL